MVTAQLGDFTFLLFTGSCSLLAFKMVKRVGSHGKLGLMCAGMFASMLFIFLGIVADCVYVIVFRVATPMPSVADLLSFLGYACAVVSTVQFLWYFRSAFGQWRYKLAPLVGVIVACPNLVLSHPNLATQTPLIADATWLAYPILDGLLSVLAIMMLMLFSGGIIFSPWRWFAVGLILITIADTVIGLGNVQGWSQLIQPFYLFYLWGYICLGLGFSRMAKMKRLHPLEQDYYKAKLMRPLDS